MDSGGIYYVDCGRVRRGKLHALSIMSKEILHTGNISVPRHGLLAAWSGGMLLALFTCRSSLLLLSEGG